MTRATFIPAAASAVSSLVACRTSAARITAKLAKAILATMLSAVLSNACAAAAVPHTVIDQQTLPALPALQTQATQQQLSFAPALRLRAAPNMLAVAAVSRPLSSPASPGSVTGTAGGAATNNVSVLDYGPNAEIAPPMRLSSGKSTLVRFEADIQRVAVGNPEHVDVMLITPREVYLLGKKSGSTNVFLWSKGAKTTIVEVTVSIDTAGLQEILRRLMPEETAIRVSAAGDSLVLTGTVADAVKVHRAVALAEQFGGRRVVNLLAVSSPAQVMLEVKIAEVSKTVLDRLGARFDAALTGGGNFRYTLITQLLSGAPGAAGVGRNGNALSIDAEIRNGLVKILAEPTIMAVSGQEGTFLAGGKIFIPVPQSGASGAAISLEEKEFGVGLRFTPTVLEGGQIHLRVTPEVSELSAVGVALSGPGGTTSVLPSITTRRASTTVQLADGQSFAIGGLVRNNVTETIRRFPGLGEMPVLGALFRSSEFQNDVSELLIIVTPRLVKPLAAVPVLPTDGFVPPTRSEFLLGGQMEGRGARNPGTVQPALNEETK